MVNKRTYVTITAMMVVILFLFMASGIIRDSWNDYSTNSFVNTTKSDVTENQESQLTENVMIRSSFVVFLGDTQDNGVGASVSAWCLFSKRALISGTSSTDLTWDEHRLPQAVLIDSAHLSLPGDMDFLTHIAAQGVPLIFCNLPDSSVIDANAGFQSILGITSTSNAQQDLTGQQLVGGFLLGGDIIYRAVTADDQKRQDLSLQTPWYTLGTGCKTYLFGLIADTSVKQYDLPPLIWRYFNGSSMVFCVNGDYMNDLTALGILTAMISETGESDLYPVVNTQSLAIGNFPDLVSENAETMNTLYNQDSVGVFRDIVWPTLSTLSEQTGIPLTCLLAPKMDYSTDTPLSKDNLTFFMRLINESFGEVGLSGYTKDGDLAGKLSTDSEFFQSALPTYQFLSFLLDDPSTWGTASAADITQNVRTVTTAKNPDLPLISFLANNVTLQQATSGGFTHTYTDDIRLRSLETALAYSNILVDLRTVIYPDSDDDVWQKMALELSSNVVTFWKPFTYFDQTTLSQGDDRLKSFLASDYAFSYGTADDNTIDLSVSGLEGEVYFILRTHGKNVIRVQGGTFRKLEEGAYLLRILNSKVVISLEDAQELFYYE